MNQMIPVPPAELETKARLVITLGEQMSDMLESEIDFMAGSPATRNVKEYGQFVTRKQKLLLDYQGAVKALLAGKDMLGSLTAERRAQIKATGARLDAMASRNAEKLSLTAAATHKVLQVIIDTVRREAQKNQTSGYSPNSFANYRDDRAPLSPPVFIAEKA